MHPEPGEGPDQRRGGAEQKLDPSDREFVALARDAAAGIGAMADHAGTPEAAIDRMAELARVDADPPLAGASGGSASPKALIRRAIRWYVQYIVDQVRAFDDAAVDALRSLAGRTKNLEDENATLRESVADIARRLETLEGGREER